MLNKAFYIIPIPILILLCAGPENNAEYQSVELSAG